MDKNKSLRKKEIKHISMFILFLIIILFISSIGIYRTNSTLGDTIFSIIFLLAAIVFPVTFISLFMVIFSEE